MTARPNLASAAFRLALKGRYVFPLTPGTRIPMKGSHGYLDATREADTVRAWWRTWPTANIGIACGAASKIWVLDIDPRHGGTMAITELEAEHGLLPATITASTPRGGRHHYWRWPDDGPKIRNSVARVGDGIDVLGEGGSVVAPPSARALGGRYAWCGGDAALADAPAWLIALTQPPPNAKHASLLVPPPNDLDRYVAAAITDELRQLAGAGPGQRNDQLNRSAFAVAQFAGAGAVDETWARSILEDTAREIGLSVIEARRTITSAFAAGLQHPRELPR
jgi:hypothetical protein